jgi:hypothetical protein
MFEMCRRQEELIQINQPTRGGNSFTSLLLDFMCGSTCFGRLPARHQGLKTALRVGGKRLEGLLFVVWKVNLPDHDQQRCYYHAPTVKPEAVNAVAVTSSIN